MDLKNKVAIITGASSGIGKAVAKELDAVGMNLVLTARSFQKLEQLGHSLKSAKVVPGEITDPELPQQLIDEAVNAFGEFNVLINNAGVMVVGAIDNVDIEALCQMVRINVEANFRMAYTALRHFKQMGNGFLINTSSVAGLKTAPEMAAYNGTKFAVEAFTDSLRVELAGTGIGVASIAPGTVETGLYDKWDEKHKAYMYTGGALRAEDIARCIRFILEQPENTLIPRLVAVPMNQPF
ncbi:MAG: SDR family oxidoreductase [Cyanobacteria bacterium J06639_18]